MHPVAEDAGVVDQDVEVAERLDRGVDQVLRALPVGDVVAVGHGLAAERLDLVDDLLRRRGVRAGSVVGATEIVDDDLGPLAGEEQRMLAADAATCARDDGDSTVQTTPLPHLLVRRAR